MFAMPKASTQDKLKSARDKKPRVLGEIGTSKEDGRSRILRAFASSPRPLPPRNLCGGEITDDESLCGSFQPAPDVADWLISTFIKTSGTLCNKDHEHLEDAHIGCLWTNYENRRQMRNIIGTAEMPRTGSGWAKNRAEYQLRQWFGEVPDFVLTFYAPVADRLTDAQWCSLVEHELYHCAQAVDEFGMQRFNQETGKPIFTMRGHDVEEFVGVVARYGVANNPDSAVWALVEAANAEPEIAMANVAHACGTCLVARSA